MLPGPMKRRLGGRHASARAAQLALKLVQGDVHEGRIAPIEIATGVALHRLAPPRYPRHGMAYRERHRIGQDAVGLGGTFAPRRLGRQLAEPPMNSSS